MDFFTRRVAQAIAWRVQAGCDPELCRLIWSEGDGLPGIIADRYRDVIVLQTLTLGMDRHKPLLVEILSKLSGVRHVIERNDVPVRTTEGLPLIAGPLFGGDPGEREIDVNGVRFLVDFLHGQKTGFYLDQIENYSIVANYASGRRVLDCFSNQGGFALACAATWCARGDRGGKHAARAPETSREQLCAMDCAVSVAEEDVFSFLEGCRAPRRPL